MKQLTFKESQQVAGAAYCSVGDNNLMTMKNLEVCENLPLDDSTHYNLYIGAGSVSAYCMYPNPAYDSGAELSSPLGRIMCGNGATIRIECHSASGCTATLVAE